MPLTISCTAKALSSSPKTRVRKLTMPPGSARLDALGREHHGSDDGQRAEDPGDHRQAAADVVVLAAQHDDGRDRPRTGEQRGRERHERDILRPAVVG